MSNNKENFKKLLRNHKGQKVLTPHFGEFSKVFHVSDNKIDDCLNAAKETDSVVLLKGNDTQILIKMGILKLIILLLHFWQLLVQGISWTNYSFSSRLLELSSSKLWMLHSL